MSEITFKLKNKYPNQRIYFTTNLPTEINKMFFSFKQKKINNHKTIDVL